MKNPDQREMKENQPESSSEGEPGSDWCAIVAMGANDGGLDAYIRFFDAMPSGGGISFVLVQHLAEEQPALTPADLVDHTRMSVVVVREDVKVEADHIYIIPCDATLTIEDCVLKVSRDAKGPQMPIDTFFRSLAVDQRDHVICVILSGTGTDGTLGLKAVKEEGGMVMAQSIGTAQYQGMPESAIATGLVDHILPVEEMPARLVEYVSHLKDVHESKRTDAIREEATESLSRICALLRRKTGHDFSRYKKSTVVRRIQRRMQVLRIESVPAYVERLRQDPKEVDSLFKDLLIGVTHFFRDADAFGALMAKVFPKIFENKGADGFVRIWVPGCATGEEAYSLAILVSEYIAKIDAPPHIQIFATDIDNHALEVARQGRYPESITEHVSVDRLERYFTNQGSLYQVNREIRDMCIFSTHNLIKDPPFSRLDLISCRNLLIYLEGDLQKKLAPLFHQALRSGGFLFLGPSESMGAHSELFRTVEKKQRIFQRKHAVIRPSVNLPLAESAWLTKQNMGWQSQTSFAREQQVAKTFERVLIENYTPASVIINEQSEIVYFSGRTGKYLELPAGAPSFHVTNMARKGLRLDLRTAIHKAVSTRRQSVQENVSVEIDGEIQRVNIIVRPLSEAGEEAGLFMVVFQEVGLTKSREQAEAEGAAPAAEHPAVLQLENELRATKEYLQTTVEELETSNEELKSSNEELLSMNEELQSANEELQTSKEELQSVNEEIQTVNLELKQKIEELDRANSDLQNLFQSTRIATIFLDNKLHIKKFTASATEVFRLIDSDIGRPITDIAPRFLEGDLVPEIMDVLHTLGTKERQVCLADRDAWFIMRILPYRTVNNVIDGVVITFVDITDLKRAEGQLVRLASIVESSQDAIISKTLDGIIMSWNKGAERLYGYSAQEAVGRPITIIFPPDRASDVDAILDRIRRGERIEPFETVRLRDNGEPVHVSLLISPIYDMEGHIIGASAIARDITDRKRVEDEIRRSRQELVDFIEHATVGLHWAGPDGVIIWANQAELDMLGYTREEYIGHHISEFHVDPDVTRDIQNRLARGEVLHNYEARLRAKDGSTRWVLMNVNVFREGGRFLHTRSFMRDITETKASADALRASEERFRFITEALPQFVWIADENGRLVECNRYWYEYTGATEEQMVSGEGARMAVHPDDLVGIARIWEPHRSEGRESRFEYRVRRASDGVYRWYLGRTMPVLDEQGKVTRWLGTAFDIDDQKRVQESLRQSEERYRAVGDSFNFGVWMADPDGNWQFVSRSLLDLVGGTMEDVRGLGWTKYLAPEQVTEVIEQWESGRAGGEDWDRELRFKGGDGAWHTVQSRARLVRDSEGKGLVWVGVNFDITDRKQAEATLRAQEEEFRTMFELAGSGKVQAEPYTGRLLRVNRKFSDLIGYAKEELRGMTFDDLTHPDERERDMEGMRRLVTGEIPSYTVEKRYIRKDGEVIWALVTATLIRSAEGEPLRTIAVVQDMTERMNAQLELQRATQEAEAANAAKDQFLAVLSHELRTPLTPVLATVEVLREEPLPEELRPFIDVIHRNIELEARLIDDLLDLTRIIKGKLRLNIEAVDVHALVQNVLDICRADISGKRLLLVVDLHAGLHHVQGDSARLQQVFWNLVKNAVKFTPEGGIVTIRSWNDGVRLMVEVADTGIGIEEEILPIIFNAFEQGEQNITRRFGGLGLGLAISKSIVDMHNGSIEARSPGRGAGATFTVTLPVTTPKEEIEGAAGGEVSDAASADGVRILVVDDHKDTASVLRLLLERRNYQVYTAYSIDAALEAAERQRFDLVISDIGLPAGSGLDLLGRLRERGPIIGIAVSGFGSQEDIARSIEAGFVTHLVKPFSARKLHEVIDQVLRGRGGA